MMEDKELIAKEIKDLEGRIGQKVIFKYPIEEGILEGKLIDRHVFRPESWAIGPGSIDVRYYNVIDRIKFPDFEAIRFGYYRRKNGKWIFAGQTTLTEKPETLKKQFIAAGIEKKGWFGKLILESAREIEK